MGWSEVILHVDMDAFFVEVERLRNPGLKNRPVAVGGTGPRSVIASASYEARRFGVRSAMPVSQALRLCPGLVLVDSNHGDYLKVSREVFGVFESFTPKIEPVSLDEAFLDISGLRRHFNLPREVADEIRRAIRVEIGLPCSVGIARNKFLAKMASKQAKPDGVFGVAYDQVRAFLHPLTVDKLWGVGPVTQAKLARMGITTVGELAEVPDGALRRNLGESAAIHLKRLANGEDHDSVESDKTTKSISVEETFPRDIDEPAAITGVLRVQASRLASRLRKEGFLASSVCVKLRLGDFTTMTRRETLLSPTEVGHEIYGAALRLFEESEMAGSPIRLIGICAGGLLEANLPRQLEIEADLRWGELERAVDSVRARFGGATIKSGIGFPPN